MTIRFKPHCMAPSSPSPRKGHIFYRSEDAWLKDKSGLLDKPWRETELPLYILDSIDICLILLTEYTVCMWACINIININKIRSII